MDNSTWFEKLIKRFWIWLANRLPEQLVYFVVVRAWTYAVGLDDKVPTTHNTITASAVLGRWHVKMRDGDSDSKPF